MDGVVSSAQSQVTVCLPAGLSVCLCERCPYTLMVLAVCPQRSSSSGGLEKMRREAQLAALRYDEERQKNRCLQRDTKVAPVPPVP